jgi:hypothetical protein
MFAQSQAVEVRRCIGFVEAIGVRFTPIQVASSIKCPYCFRDIPSFWESLHRQERNGDYREGIEVRGDDSREEFQIEWMTCINDECKQVIVRIRHSYSVHGLNPTIEDWFAVPRKRASRPIDPLVPDKFSKPYIRASLILEDAPDMSGVLARRILQDLLKTYAGRTEYKLEDQIDRFIEDRAHPSRYKDNLHVLRDMGNFGAHTKTNKLTDEIVDISPEEAEWTLDVIDGLLDYFIISNEKDRLRHEAWERKRGPQNPPIKKSK